MAEVKLAHARRALQRARSLVLQAQIAHARGDTRRALELARAALEQVPLHRLPRFSGQVLH